MKENNDTNPEITTIKKRIPVWRWIALLAVIGVGGYFGLQQLGGLAFSNIFTEYHPITNDTLMQTSPVDSILEKNNVEDSTLVVLEDSSKVSIPQDSVADETPQYENPAPVESSTVDLFKVNTTYGKIDSATAIAAAEVEIKPNENPPSNNNPVGLFEELLLPEKVDPEFEKAFGIYSQAPIVSSKSVLKLLSIVGKQILLGKNTEDVQEIIQTLTESEVVIGILIVDRKGKVIYATNQKQINTKIQNIMPKVDMNSAALSWYQEEEKTVAAIPIFHIYGKIGQAVLVTGR